MSRKKALGRGIGAVIPTGGAENQDKNGIVEIPLDRISVNPGQPRKEFDEETLMELAASISEVGIIQPLTVRKLDDDSYELIAGERRYRACRYLNYDKVPAYVRNVTEDQASMELALIENIQRENLNAVEEAEAYSTLIDRYGLSQEAVAQRVGKKRSTVTNSLRLLRLPGELRSSLISHNDNFTAGHARAILALEDDKRMVSLWNRVLADKLSVRRTEELVTRIVDRDSGTKRVKSPGSGKKSKSPWQRDIESKLQAVMGTRVQVKHSPKNEGKIEIEYYSREDLDRLLEIFDSIEL